MTCKRYNILPQNIHVGIDRNRHGWTRVLFTLHKAGQRLRWYFTFTSEKWICKLFQYGHESYKMAKDGNWSCSLVIPLAQPANENSLTFSQVYMCCGREPRFNMSERSYLLLLALFSYQHRIKKVFYQQRHCLLLYMFLADLGQTAMLRGDKIVIGFININVHLCLKTVDWVTLESLLVRILYPVVINQSSNNQQSRKHG